MSAPSYVVTLVHGTFARGAAWTRPGSSVSQALETNLQSVLVCFCDWSGKNTHDERISGSVELKQHLLHMGVAYPASKHVVIAHSHGGNVTLYALRDKELRSAIAGVVTMGTPFITCTPRLISSTVTFLSYVAGIISLCVLATSWIAIEHRWFRELLVIRIGGVKSGSPLLGFGLGLAVWFAVQTYRFVNSKLLGWALLKQKELSERFDVGFFTHPPFLCATVDGDEPRRWLKVVSGASGLPAQLFGMKMRMLGIRTIVTTIVVGLLLGHHSLKWLGGAVIYTFLMAWLALSLYQFFAVFLPRVVRAHRYAFGGEAILDNWLNDIRISLTPKDVGVPITEVDLGSTSAPGLAHSVFYNDVDFLGAMCTWIREL